MEEGRREGQQPQLSILLTALLRTRIAAVCVAILFEGFPEVCVVGVFVRFGSGSGGRRQAKREASCSSYSTAI